MSKAKTRAPEQTLEESRYLRTLVDRGSAVGVKLADNQTLEGRIEFFDVSFIRLTRAGEPNLFIYKHDIKYLYELPE
jgi:host factor-I protein